MNECQELNQDGRDGTVGQWIRYYLTFRSVKMGHPSQQEEGQFILHLACYLSNDHSVLTPQLRRDKESLQGLKPNVAYFFPQGFGRCKLLIGG
jgi:hypothetical protein